MPPHMTAHTKLAIKPCPTTLPLAELSWEVLPPGSSCRKHTLNSPMQLITWFCHWLLHIYTLVVIRYGRLLSSPTSTFWLRLYARQNIPTKSKLKQSLPPAVLKHPMFDSWSLCLLKSTWRAKITHIFILYLYVPLLQCLFQINTYASSTNTVPHHSWHGWHELKIRDVTKCSVESVRGGDTCFHSFGILCVNKLLLLLHLIYMYLRHYYLKIYTNSLSYFTVHLRFNNSHHNNLHLFCTKWRQININGPTLTTAMLWHTELSHVRMINQALWEMLLYLGTSRKAVKQNTARCAAISSCQNLIPRPEAKHCRHITQWPP